MRVMAIDYGDVRTGIAVSDETASLTGEAWVVVESGVEKLAKTIAAEASSRNVSAIVVGYPKNMDGSIGPRAEKSEQLAEAVRKLCGIAVELWDERLTTMSANRILTATGRRGKKRKEKIDAVAASLILESYLGGLGNRA